MELYHLQLADDDDSFDKYPWGRLSYELTIRSFKNALNNQEVPFYWLSRFPHAVAVWAFETMPFFRKFGFAYEDTQLHGPRILN